MSTRNQEQTPFLLNHSNRYSFVGNAPVARIDFTGLYYLPNHRPYPIADPMSDPVLCAVKIKTQVWENHCEGDTRPPGDRLHQPIGDRPALAAAHGLVAAGWSGPIKNPKPVGLGVECLVKAV